MEAYKHHFDHHGYVVVADVFVGDELAQLQENVAALASMPNDPDGVWQYDEVTGDGTALRCRTENFVPYHKGLRQQLVVGVIPAIADTILGEASALFKEKINYKNPGGAGFVAHQDAPAYPNVTTTIACLIAVDPFTLDNGCLEVVPEGHLKDFGTDDRGCIPDAEAAAQTWKPLVVPAGSATFFHARLPHRSGPNTSQTTRRGIYLTFHPAEDGDQRTKYYAKKRVSLAADQTKFSLIDHFDGTLQASDEDSATADPASPSNKAQNPKAQNLKEQKPEDTP